MSKLEDAKRKLAIAQAELEPLQKLADQRDQYQNELTNLAMWVEETLSGKIYLGYILPDTDGKELKYEINLDEEPFVSETEGPYDSIQRLMVKRINYLQVQIKEIDRQLV